MQAITTIKSRGAVSSPFNRFAKLHKEFDEIDKQSIVTECHLETVSSIISTNQSPDVPFDRSINPYKGCEHGCIYCFARPTHNYLDLSAGLDFETKIVVKRNAATKLEEAFNKANYQVKPIALGANTDPYQPIERRYQITRSLLKVFSQYQHPLTIVTKGALIERDIDLLKPMAAKGLVSVMISLTSANDFVKRVMEPRAASNKKRLDIIAQLSNAGIPVGVLIAPIIPFINDQDMETLLEQGAKQGARWAAPVLLRLPLELDKIFSDWLFEHFPHRAGRVLHAIEQTRQGKRNSAQFGDRMTGTGPLAQLIQHRFQRACKAYGLNTKTKPILRTDLFSKHMDQEMQQLSLFS